MGNKLMKVAAVIIIGSVIYHYISKKDDPPEDLNSSSDQEDDFEFIQDADTTNIIKEIEADPLYQKHVAYFANIADNTINEYWNSLHCPLILKWLNNVNPKFNNILGFNKKSEVTQIYDKGIYSRMISDIQ